METEEKTEREIAIAYSVARRIAASFMTPERIALYRPHMEMEDYIQEGVLGWLEGKDIYRAIVTAYRKDSPVTWWRRAKGDKEPSFVPLQDDALLEDPTDNIARSEQRMDAEKILALLDNIEDDTKRFAVCANLYFGMSLRQIAEVLGSTHETVRKMIKPEIEEIRRKLGC